MKHLKRIIKILLIVCVVHGLISWTLYEMIAELSTSKAFQANEWKKDIEQRMDMVSSLEKDYLKKGMTKEEVIKLLDEPDGRHPDGPNYTWDKRFDYDLGNNGFDPCEFTIYFDENEQVVSWKQMCW